MSYIKRPLDSYHQGPIITSAPRHHNPTRCGTTLSGDDHDQSPE
jgi:hypothetical protein